MRTTSLLLVALLVGSALSEYTCAAMDAPRGRNKAVVRVRDDPDFVFEFRTTGGLDHYSRMTNAELRELFLVEGLFAPGRVHLVHSDLDRAIIGSVVPTTASLTLNSSHQYLASKTFLERRELAILNLGGPGTVTIDSVSRTLKLKQLVYAGRGSGSTITFGSVSASNPALFYLVSYPAHAQYPTALVTPEDAETSSAGAAETANLRKISKMVHMNGAKSCQLVMGFTELASGSIWNTMPPHLHERRTEIYLYVGLGEEDRVFHMMGPPEDTRKIVVANLQAVMSPPWSVHCGAGTRAYTFVWAMGGENQDFNDMQSYKISQLL